MWNVSYGLFLGLTAVAAVAVLSLLFRRRLDGRIRVTHILMTYCFLSTIALCIPTFIEFYDVSFFSSLLMSFPKAVKIFGGDAVIDEVLQCFEKYRPSVAEVYLAGIMFVQILSPVCTVSFALSFIKNLSAYAGFVLRFFKDTFVFSELNEKTYVLAESIGKTDKDSIIIFTSVNDEMSKGELAQKAKKLGAIFFEKDILAIDFNRHSPKKKLSFVLMSENETLNISQALKLTEEFYERDKTHIYAMSKNVEGEILISGADKGKVKVRRINEVTALINRILYDNEMDLFGKAVDDGEEEKLISAVVVGMGAYGKEAIKALSWFSQMDGYRIEINAFDKDPLAEEKFKAAAPELMSEKFNGKKIPGEMRSKINIHPGCEAGTAAFEEKIRSIKNITYVMVALGDDELNVRTAVELRTLFERMRIKPFIHSVVFARELKEVLKNLKNFNKQEYNICFVGGVDTLFSSELILGSELEKEALERHLKWGSEEDFWNYEYNYRSSVAAALHINARIACGIPGADKKEEELTDYERAVVEGIEHRRWNAYMRSEGYIYSGSPDKKSRNDLGKMHHNLVPYQVLSDEDKRKDSKVGTKN